MQSAYILLADAPAAPPASTVDGSGAFDQDGDVLSGSGVVVVGIAGTPIVAVLSIVPAVRGIIAAMATVTQGTRIPIRVTFTRDGAAFDPAIVTFVMTIGDDWFRNSGRRVALRYGVDATLVRDGVGLYHVDYLCNTPGKVRVQFASAAVNEESVIETSFTVAAATVP